MTQLSDVSLSKLQVDIRQALKLWHNADSDASPLGYLYLFQRVLRQGAGNARQATNELLLDGLKVLEADHSPDADLLRMRFLDGIVMRTVASQLNLAESTANKKQRQAIHRLAAILYARERQARDERQAILERRLELPPDIRLIRIENHLRNLLGLVVSPGPPWLASIEGLGGIGKTSLANALVRRIAQRGRFYDIAWVSAKQQEFLPSAGVQVSNRPALDADTLIDSLLEQFDSRHALARSPQEKMASLTKLLKKVPHLVVIDNLETVVDYQALLPVLRKLADPSKFLLTSRHSLRAYSDVSCFDLQELDRAGALAFLRYEAKSRRLEALANASEAQLQSVYEVVGGNPLALKLVVGQIAALPLSQVLDSLKQARGKTIDDLYIYIYWQAWEALDAAGRQAFLPMPLVQNGTITQLAAVSELEADDLNQALEQLAALSLVEVGGDIEQRRYRIHRLTETFLLTEVVKWQSSL